MHISMNIGILVNGERRPLVLEVHETDLFDTILQGDHESRYFTSDMCSEPEESATQKDFFHDAYSERLFFSQLLSGRNLGFGGFTENAIARPKIMFRKYA